ncbi:MAG: hypothetical protein IJ662_11985 [Clostridia bacterium]|nr:hypothetical protein [Clostridia bacterium]
MTRILAILMAAVMALSCVGTLAETEKATATYTLNDELFDSLAGMLLGGDDEGTQELLGHVKALINNLGLYAAEDDNNGVFQLTLAGQPVLSCAVSRTEDGGLVAVSDLFPSYALTVSGETLNQLMSMLNDEAMQEMVEKVITAIVPRLEAYMTAVMSKVGEPEVGEFAIDGATFTLRVPIEITAQELAELTLDLVAGCAQDLVEAGVIPADQLPDFESAKAELAQSENVPQLSMNLYGTMDAETGEPAINYVVGVIENENDNVLIMGGTVNDQVVYHVLYGAKTYETADAIREAASNGASDAVVVDVIAAGSESFLGLEVDVFAQAFFAVVMEMTKQESLITAQTAYYVLTDAAPLLTVNVVGEMNADIEIAPVEIGERTVLAVEDLIAAYQKDGENAPEITALLQDVAMNGLGTVLGNAANAMPETVMALMNLFSQMSAIPDETVVEETKEAEDDEEIDLSELEEMSEEELEELLNQLFEELELDEAVEEAPAA